MKKTKENELLDIGCGTGDFINYMKRKGWSVTGVETDQMARELAEKKPDMEVYSSVSDEKLWGKYDVITMWHVLEHVYDLNTF